MTCICSSVVLYGLLDIPDSDTQIRKSRRCSRHTKKYEIKRKTKSKSCRNKNTDTFEKDVLTLDDTLPLNENDLSEVKSICNEFDHDLPDECDACCTCQTVLTNLSDKLPPDTLATPTSDNLEVPWNPSIYDLKDALTFEDNHSYESVDLEESVNVDGEIVCSIAVPDLTRYYDQRNTTTGDDDKDSGVYSEEQSFCNESPVDQPGQASISDVGTLYTDNRDDSNHVEYFDNKDEGIRYKHHEKSKSDVKGLLEEELEFISPFERKVWKRRNGRYKVRNPMCPPQLFKATINYADHEGELGSERSVETGPDNQEQFKFLRDIEDIETGKECKLEIERENCIRVSEGTSDSRLPGNNTTQQTYQGQAELQARLAQMKSEIAAMVAEAVELDNILGESGESGDEINDVTSPPDRHYTMQPENSDFSETESNDSESGSENDTDDVLSDYDYISSYSD